MKIPWTEIRSENRIVKARCAKKILELVEHPDYILGRETTKFEKNFARFCGVGRCIGVANGTDALRLGLLACGVCRDDEVITSPISYIATSLAVAHCGARPVFVDVREDGNIDPSKIEAAITRKTKAILVVHMFGNMCDMKAILRIARKHKIPVIDDCAHAHGSRQNGKRAGSIADISCFSFYPTKSLGGWGDAGALTTNDARLAKIIAMLRNYGEREKHNSELLGFNSRLDTIQAIVLNEKLKHLPRWLSLRSRVARRYDVAFRDIAGIERIAYSPDTAWYIYPIKTSRRDELMDYLRRADIGSAIHYPLPIHLQKCFAYLGHKAGDFPLAEKHAKMVMSLPFGPFLDRKDQERVIRVIKSFFAQR